MSPVAVSTVDHHNATAWCQIFGHRDDGVDAGVACTNDADVRSLNEKTLPSANATLEDLQSTSRSLRSLTQRIEDKGASDLINSPKLPDYEPED